MKRISKIKTALLEVVFPSDLYCISCGRIIDKTRYYGLCDKCAESISWVSSETCSKCGRLMRRTPDRSAGFPVDESAGGQVDTDTGEIHGTEDDPLLCGDCRLTERHFDRGYTCAFYGVCAREIIAAMKMRKRPWIGRKLGEAMADRMAWEEETIDLVIPVPVHPKREKKRGYNQAAVIGRSFAEKYRERVVFLDALIRSRDTAPMKGLDVWQRKTGIEGAFRLKPGMENVIKGKTVALVDDIMTTGSTLSECAGALKEAGPARIITITFAAGGDMNVPEDGA